MDKLQLIHVGLGAHGRGVGHDIVAKSPDFVYAGLVDPDRRALTEFASMRNIPEDRLYADHRQAFAELKADAVLITAASPMHYTIGLAALEQGLHVLVEKPFTLSLEEAEHLVQIADHRGLRIMVNQNYRYFSRVMTLRHAIHANELGKLLYVHGQFYCDHDGKPYQREMDNYIVLEMSIHHIDMIRYMLDDDIADVRGRSWNSGNSGYKGDPHVSAVYTTKHKKIPVFYTASLLAQGEPVPWEGIWKVQYENGAIYLDDRGHGYDVYIEPDGEERFKPEPINPEREGIHGVLAEFAAAIRKGREPAMSGRDNLHTLSAVMATVRG